MTHELIVSANCDRDVVMDSGTIDVPSEPAGYHGPQECGWKYTVATLNAVLIWFPTFTVGHVTSSILFPSTGT